MIRSSVYRLYPGTLRRRDTALDPVKRTARFTYLCLCLTALAGCADTGGLRQPEPVFNTSEFGVTEFTLVNNMKVLVKEDHRAPVAIVQLWYRVGSNDEPGGLTGISHALEHMMFKGTPKYPADEFTHIIKREGGRYNAFTSSDYTVYYESFEKSRIPISFRLESDRMVNLAMREEDFAKEINVVMEERRLRVEDRPKSRLYEQLYATAFTASPSRQPVIGWMDDLRNMRLADLEGWYARWYAPNNALLMVAGDVTPEEVYQLAMRYMAPLQPVPLPERKSQQEPPQHGEKRITVKLVAERDHILLGYRAPRVGQTDQPWEPYALKVLAAVLSSGGAARFPKHLVRGRKIAQSASASYSPYSVHETLFVISASPARGLSASKLEAAIEEEIELIKNEGVEPEELERIKTKVYAREIYSRDSLSHQAYMLASLEVTGAGWEAAYDFPELIRQVTPQQVQAVARKYLVREKRTVAILDPQPLPQAGDDSSA